MEYEWRLDETKSTQARLGLRLSEGKHCWMMLMFGQAMKEKDGLTRS